MTKSYTAELHRLLHIYRQEQRLRADELRQGTGKTYRLIEAADRIIVDLNERRIR